MKSAMRRAVAAGLLGLAMAGPGDLLAQDTKIEFKPALTIRALLADVAGKRVILRMEAGEEIEGTVSAVGEQLVHVSKLAKREFFDAYVNIDRISAVIVRVK
ncbi:MAG: hypothetical protein ACKVP2_04050 [Burkholderiales bacterium]